MEENQFGGSKVVGVSNSVCSLGTKEPKTLGKIAHCLLGEKSSLSIEYRTTVVIIVVVCVCSGRKANCILYGVLYGLACVTKVGFVCMS